MTARHLRAGLLLTLVGVLTAATATAMPRSHLDLSTLVRVGESVTSIPAADGVNGFELLDDEHVMLSARDKRYLLTLNGQCVGLRWARHVGVTASDNAIWVGFDALTADGEACPIRAIHLLPESAADAL